MLSKNLLINILTTRWSSKLPVLPPQGLGAKSLSFQNVMVDTKGIGTLSPYGEL